MYLPAFGDELANIAKTGALGKVATELTGCAAPKGKGKEKDSQFGASTPTPIQPMTPPQPAAPQPVGGGK